jgi:hypothetical protein
MVAVTERRHFKMRRSAFTYTIDGNTIFVVDSNIGMSVTNDIENVVEEMAVLIRSLGKSINEFNLIYRDSTGEIDGVLIKDEKFDEFYHIGESDYEVAKTRIIKGQ